VIFKGSAAPAISLFPDFSAYNADLKQSGLLLAELNILISFLLAELIPKAVFMICFAALRKEKGYSEARAMAGED